MLSIRTSQLDTFDSTEPIIASDESLRKYSSCMDIEKDSLPEFSVWLQRQLKRRGWSGSELARRMDLNHAGTVNNWLAGRRALKDGELIRRLAEALSVHQDEILELLDMRDGGADHMSLAVRRLQPLIDSVQWNEGTYRMVESLLVSIREMQSGTFTEPKASWEDDE